jgi:signal transduction histidine kinase
MESMFDIETLLTKYAGGRMPSLVDLENPASGLINGELLRIYHSGLRSRLPTPLGILLAASDRTSLEKKWLEGDFRPNKWGEKDWTLFCKTLRKSEVCNAACEKCDRRRAIIAEREGGVIAYLCDHGLIDFAVPVSVKGQIVATLFCGQFRPKAEAVWNAELVERDGLFRLLAPEEEGVNVWAEASLKRIDSARRMTELPEEEVEALLQKLEELSPEQVEEYRGLLRRIAGQLSVLATSTYDSEKGKVVDWIRHQITRSLLPLSTTPVDTSQVWEELAQGLEHLVTFFELDYALILSCCDETKEGFEILCQFGLSEVAFPVMEKVPMDTASLSALRIAVCGLETPVPIVFKEYRDMPLFDRLHRMHARKRSKQALVIPMSATLGAAAPIMILGKFGQNIGPDSFSPDDRQALMRIVEGVTLVADTILLVEQLEGATEKQALFLEDVAHDIRTPIQNIIVEATLLTRESTSPETKDLARSLAAQVRRLHLMSQRVWTLVNLDRGLLEPDEVQSVQVYQTLMEHRKSLLDLAAKRGIQILVDRELQGWPAIRVNETLFSQAVLNLIDNAIKYSRKGTEVRIDGKRLPDGVTLSFVSRGIPIREEDKDRIFERYYRTKEAQMYVMAGTGIGLFIAKTFLDYCDGSIEVKSEPIHGTRDYVTEFKLFIPHRR